MKTILLLSLSLAAFASAQNSAVTKNSTTNEVNGNLTISANRTLTVNGTLTTSTPSVGFNTASPLIWAGVTAQASVQSGAGKHGLIVRSPAGTANAIIGWSSSGGVAGKFYQDTSYTAPAVYVGRADTDATIPTLKIGATTGNATHTAIQVANIGSDTSAFSVAHNGAIVNTSSAPSTIGGVVLSSGDISAGGGPLTISAPSTTFATGSIGTSQPLTLTQTWTNNATTYTGMRINVTDTASNAASLLMDLQVGGTSRFQVNKAGVVKLNNSGTITWTDANNLTFFSGEGYQRVRAYTFWGSGLAAGIGDNGTPSEASVHLASGARLGWTSGGVVNAGTYDVFLQRDAANTLAQRNSTNAQAFRLYNSYNGTTSFERLNFRWDSNVAKIGTEKGSGGGTARDLAFETNGTERVRVLSTGNVGIGTTTPTALLDVNSNTVRVRTARTPASANATGNAGDICWDAEYIYVCTATDTWKRTAISTW